MNPAIFFPIAGAALIVWGSIVAIWNQWAAGFMKTTQGIYGKRAAAAVTPPFVRLIGICLAVGGVVVIVLALVGVFPDHS